MKFPKTTTLEKLQKTVNLDRKSKKSNRTLKVQPINLPLSMVSLLGDSTQKNGKIFEHFEKTTYENPHSFYIVIIFNLSL